MLRVLFQASWEVLQRASYLLASAFLLVSNSSVVVFFFLRMIFPKKVIQTVREVSVEFTAPLSPSLLPSSPKHWELSKIFYYPGG